MCSYKRISVYEADNLLSASMNAILLDARDDYAYREKHHPRAQLFTDMLMGDIIQNVDKNVPILIYCYLGHNSRAIAKTFSEFGFLHCFSVDGGYSAWRHQISYEFPKSERLKRWLASKNGNLDINARLDSNSTTALMLAAKEDNSDIARDLIDAGADPNLTDIKGNNALWYACISQSLECAQLLINADIEADNQNQMGFSALNYAVGMDDMFTLISDSIGDNILKRLTNNYEQSHHKNLEHADFLERT